MLINQPFEIYFDYVIEAKHGFNKTKISTFIYDRVIGIILTLIVLIITIPTFIYIYNTAHAYVFLIVNTIKVIVMDNRGYIYNIYNHYISKCDFPII